MNKRGLLIMEELNEKGKVEVSALSKRLGVSAVTVRKDLEMMEQKGLLRRQHGMAVLISPDDIDYRMTFDYEVKRRIAKEAASMVKKGETIMIESGSTCAMLAEELLLSKLDATIITNSAFIAGHVRSLPWARVVLLGGDYNTGAQVMTGPLVRLCAQSFFVDKFFIGTDGYEPLTGFSNVDMLRAEAVRDMAERAKHRIILTDSSKFNKRGVVPLLPAKAVSMVITDATPEDCAQSLREAGVEIRLV